MPRMHANCESLTINPDLQGMPCRSRKGNSSAQANPRHEEVQIVETIPVNVRFKKESCVSEQASSLTQ
jgi:hypothetical protein